MYIRIYEIRQIERRQEKLSFAFFFKKTWVEIVAYRNGSSNNKLQFDYFSNNVYDKVYIH